MIGTAPNRELVVGFYSVHHCCRASGPAVTFEMILHESTSHIELQYGDVPDDGEFVVTGVGIKNFDGTDGLQIAHGDDVAFKNRGFLITHPCPYNFPEDRNYDCVYNLLDFAISAERWLVDCIATPNNPACGPI